MARPTAVRFLLGFFFWGVCSLWVRRVLARAKGVGAFPSAAFSSSPLGTVLFKKVLAVDKRVPVLGSWGVGGPLAVTRLWEWGVGRSRFISFDLL